MQGRRLCRWLVVDGVTRNLKARYSACEEPFRRGQNSMTFGSTAVSRLTITEKTVQHRLVYFATMDAAASTLVALPLTGPFLRSNSVMFQRFYHVAI